MFRWWLWCGLGCDGLVAGIADVVLWPVCLAVAAFSGEEEGSGLLGLVGHGVVTLSILLRLAPGVLAQPGFLLRCRELS